MAAHRRICHRPCRISNCHSDDVEWAIREIEAIQAQNKRARGDRSRGERTYHLVVSFPPGERPSPAQLHDIEDELCRAIGLQKHQRISAVHTDTEHLHMHVAINQVHPHSLACIEPWYDKQKLMRACRMLEIKYELIRPHHGEAKGKKRPQAAAAAAADRQASSFSGWAASSWLIT